MGRRLVRTRRTVARLPRRLHGTHLARVLDVGDDVGLVLSWDRDPLAPAAGRGLPMSRPAVDVSAGPEQRPPAPDPSAAGMPDRSRRERGSQAHAARPVSASPAPSAHTPRQPAAA